MNLFQILSSLEIDDDIHLSRLLVLLNVFAGPENTGKIEGLTKLAKLDFLLRYPVYLERALVAKNKSTQKIDVKSYERRSVESSMVRYRYGPWDHRYRRFINILVAKEMAEVTVKGRTIEISLTPQGQEIAMRLSNDESFIDISQRAKLLKTHFDLQGTNLMKFVYETFPEIATLKMGEEIGT